MNDLVTRFRTLIVFVTFITIISVITSDDVEYVTTVFGFVMFFVLIILFVVFLSRQESRSGDKIRRKLREGDHVQKLFAQNPIGEARNKLAQAGSVNTHPKKVPPKQGETEFEQPFSSKYSIGRKTAIVLLLLLLGVTIFLSRV